MNESAQVAVGTVALLAAIVLGLWLVMVPMPGQSFRGELPPPTPAGTQAAARLEADVRHLAVTIGERSVFRPEGLEQARAFIATRFEELGYAVREDTFESYGQAVHNVEATLPGAAPGAEVILVGAHYDSVTGTVGANDNGSGVAAVLELARRLRGERLARTLRFVAFVNEEPPFFNIGEMGSQHYADAAARGPERIVAMLSLETIGYYSDAPGSQHYPFPFNLAYPDRGDFVGFVGNVGSRQLVRRSVALFRASAAFPSEGVAAPAWVPGIAWSDHGSFWPHGIPAIMVTDTAPYRYPHYHTPADLPERMDFARMARVVGGLEGVVRGLGRE